MRAKEAPKHIKADWPGSALIVELLASGRRDGMPFKAKPCCDWLGSTQSARACTR